MNERGAIIARIKGDAPTADLLDTYEGEAAVFSPKKPADYEYKPDPAVLVRVPTDVSDVSAFRATRSSILLAVSVYAQLPENSTDDTAVDVAAKAIRALFRGKKFVGPDGLTYQALVSGPIAAPTDSDLMVGRLLQIRLNVGG